MASTPLDPSEAEASERDSIPFPNMSEVTFAETRRSRLLEASRYSRLEAPHPTTRQTHEKGARTSLSQEHPNRSQTLRNTHAQRQLSHLDYGTAESRSPAQ